MAEDQKRVGGKFAQNVALFKKSYEGLTAGRKNKLMRIIFGADLRSGHNGLYDQSKKAGFDPDDLGAGEFVVFVNRAKTGLKMFASGRSMLGYYKSPSGQINVKVLRVLPKYFNGGELHYQAALDEVIRSEVRVTQ